MNEFFDELGRAFAEVARERGEDIEVPRLDPHLAEELLDFSRVVAHTRERRFAPLATYIAGVAAGRMKRDAEIGEIVKAIRLRYEPQEESPKEAR
jgi:uncharacterized protein DUF6457